MIEKTASRVLVFSFLAPVQRLQEYVVYDVILRKNAKAKSRRKHRPRGTSICASLAETAFGFM